MEKVYDIGGLPVTVAFKQGLVSIDCDTHLWRLADRRQRSDFIQLVNHIYRDHQTRFAVPLSIRKRSLLLEIQGHIYADYYLLRYASFFRFLFRNRLYTRFLQSCEEIDCGDRSNDPNRWFWDKISVFSFLFHPFFPRNISRKYVK